MEDPLTQQLCLLQALKRQLLTLTNTLAGKLATRKRSASTTTKISRSAVIMPSGLAVDYQQLSNAVSECLATQMTAMSVDAQATRKELEQLRGTVAQVSTQVSQLLELTTILAASAKQSNAKDPAIKASTADTPISEQQRKQQHPYSTAAAAAASQQRRQNVNGITRCSTHQPEHNQAANNADIDQVPSSDDPVPVSSPAVVATSSAATSPVTSPFQTGLPCASSGQFWFSVHQS